MAVTISGSGQVIVKVASATQTAVFTTASTSWVDFTGLSVTLTPTNANSKFLVKFTSGVSNDTINCFQFAKLVRNGTDISIGDAAGSVTRASADGSFGNVGAYDVTQKPIAVNYVDSPATTSAVTYKVQVIRTLSGTSYWGRTSSTIDANRSSIASNLIVMEISG